MFAPAWAGPLMQSYELPNGNALLGTTVGQVTTVRGTDPLPYASGVLRAWQLPGLDPQPADADFWPGTIGSQPGAGADDSPSPWKVLGGTVLLAVVALLVLGVGLFALTREG